MDTTGGPRSESPGTVSKLFFETLATHDKPDALLVKIDGAYRPISHATVRARARHIAVGLERLGIKHTERVGIMSENCPEWALVDWGTLTGGYTNVPVYPTLPAGQAAYVLRDAGAVILFVSTAEQARKAASFRGEVPSLRLVVGFGRERFQGCDLTVAELEARGAQGETPESIAEYEQKALAIDPGAVATLIYTSGTTGEPKGVMLTHDNLYSNVKAALSVIPFYDGTDVGLSFLPLSHSFERMAGHLAMFSTGTTIAYAESVDAVAQNMLEVKPTVMVAVPRLYEKIYSRIFENAHAGGSVKRAIFNWALRVGDRWADEKLEGREPRGLLAAQYGLAQKLVFDKLKQRTGGRLRYFISGGAPLSPTIAKFFYAAGLQIVEGYGLTESSPVITTNRVDDFRIGSVGKPIPGVEVRIAEDGEILSRGPHIMKGYYGKDEATREAVDAEGWLHTGDVGTLNGGFLYITDRKKDLIVTAGGKNIAPQPIENRVKTNRWVNQVVMLGDKRKFPIMLIVPAFEVLEPWARAQAIPFADRRQLVVHPDVVAKIEREVLGSLEGLARFEMPKKVGLLAEELTIERGEITPSLKVKRRAVEKNHAALIDSLYRERAGADPLASVG